MIVCPTVNLGNFFTTYITPLASPLIALAVGIVAYRQWRTARDKLRFDLYERRLHVYDAALTYLEMAMQSEDGLPHNRVQINRDFTHAWREARFLFGRNSKVYEMLTEMDTQVNIVLTPLDAAKALYNAQAHEAACQRRQTSLNWVWVASEYLADAFEPYLDFRQLQNVGAGSDE